MWQPGLLMQCPCTVVGGCAVQISVHDILFNKFMSRLFFNFLFLNMRPQCLFFNLLTPNDDYSGRTAPLTSKCCILYIYSTNTGTEYFKHDIYSPFFPLQNAVCFIILTYLVPVLFTFYIQGVLKFKKIIPAPKG